MPGSESHSTLPADAEATRARATAADAVTQNRSSWTLQQKIARVAWMLVRGSLFRWSFHNWYGWRRFLLRCFGARVGHDARLRPTVMIEIPWNLELGDHCRVGDHAILYSLGTIRIGRLAVISQYAHLCAGTHDYTLRSFPLRLMPIAIGEEAWIAADAFVGPGISVGDRAVVGARAVVVKDVGSAEVVVGNPARVVKIREIREG
jgi:putative colanic acid biosynthesis acetyltransferase WcaF